MQPSFLDILTILPPSGAQIAALLGLLAVSFAFVLIGAAVAGRDRWREADLITGWAVVSAVMTVGGRLTPLPLQGLAGLVLAAALAAAYVLWRRREAPLAKGDWWMVVALVPFLAVTASMQPSQWDEFSQWLPNARYLVLFNTFPGVGTPVSDSVFPAYPHAIPLLPYLSSLLAGHFAEGVAPWFNLLLLASLGRLAIRLFRQDATLTPAAAAWGLLAVTAFSTTFIPKLVLSTYADTATAVGLAFAAALGLRVVTAKAGEACTGYALQFAAAFALLPMTKQGNFALMGLLLAALAFEAWRNGSVRRLPKLALWLIPAVAVTLAWRSGMVAGVGELGVRPLSGWEWDILPAILESMATVIMSKGGYFGLGAVLTVAALWRLRSAEWEMARVFALVFLGYNAFLLFVYLAVLSDYESANAASYWRYNTHTGGIQMLAAASAAGLLWRRYGRQRRTLAAVLAGLGIALVAVAPVAALKNLRFDRQPVKVHIHDVAEQMAPLLPAGTALVVVDPRGSGFYAHYVDYLLGFGRQVSLSINAFSGNPRAADLAPAPNKALWIHTQTPAVMTAIGMDLPENASHLLLPEGGQWKVARSWPFPGYDDPTAIKD